MAERALVLLLAAVLLARADALAAAPTERLLQIAVPDHVDRRLAQWLPGAIEVLQPATPDGRRIVLNAVPRADELAIVVLAVDHRLEDAVGGDPEVRDLALALRGNALAISPNLILIDGAFIDFVLLNAAQNLIGYYQTLDLAAKVPTGEATEVDVRRFGKKMRLLIDRDRARWVDQWSVERRGEYLRQSLAYFGTGLADPHVHPTVDFAVAPVLFHEIGHLGSGGLLSFRDTWEKLKDALERMRRYPATQLRLAEERRADAYAAERIRATVDAAFRSRKPYAGEAVQAVVATLKLFRDLVVRDVFGNFRGLPPEDYLYWLEHEPCASWTSESEPLWFGHVARTRSIRDAPFPLLTAEEFARFRRRLDGHVADGTHPHHFQRAAILLEALRGFVPDFYFEVLLDARVAMQEALGEDRPELLAPRSSGDVGLRRVEFVDALKGAFDLRPAVNCAGTGCLVGVPTSDPGPASGFLEIAARGDAVERVRLVLPVYTENDRGVMSADNVLLSRMDLLALVAARLLGEPAALIGSRTRRLLAEVSDEMAACGAVSRTVVLAERTVEITTLNDLGWMALEARPLGR